MVDLHGQYRRLKKELDEALAAVLESCAFINGPQVSVFAAHLAAYVETPFVIPCANGTDALQIALMALDLKPGDEVIVPAFTYAAAAEVAALLGLVPVLAEVDGQTFNLDVSRLEETVSPRTKAVIAVHLFGQCCDMEPLLTFARSHGLYVIEDNAQSIGSRYRFSDGTVKAAGTMGDIGTVSFFPSKPLACYGDGGALFTSDARLAEQIRMIANHGQKQKYHHERIGCNSRLDTLQAAVLDIKLKHIDAFAEARIGAARRYDAGLADIAGIRIPFRASYSSHIYHQYTIQVAPELRDGLQRFLKEKGIPTMVYYPLPLQAQEAFGKIARIPGCLDVAAQLSRSVLSLPMHTELTAEMLNYIIESVREGITTLSAAEK